MQIVKFPMLDASGTIDAIGTISIDVTELNSARIAAEAAAELVCFDPVRRVKAAMPAPLRRRLEALGPASC